MATHQPVRIVSPYPNTFRFRAKAEFERKSLLRLMSTRFPFNTVNIWRMKIENGLVGVNGNEVEPDYSLTKQDEIYHYNPKIIEPSVPNEVRILQETDEYLMVFKPAPLPMHPGGRFNKNSLTAILQEQGYQDLRIVHRLDAVTSGLALFARNKQFAQQAMHCFRELKVKKTYFAHVSGCPVENAITIDAPIRRKNGFVFESELGLHHAKKAVTHFEVMERRKDSAIVQCNPQTGRTHQIRLHLEQWGHPIIDDPIYGLNGDKSRKHAQKIGISLINAGLEIEELGVNFMLKNPEF